MNDLRAREILKYYTQASVVERFLRDHYRHTPGSKIRRGIVCDSVKNTLDLPLNPHTHRRITKTMLAMGGRRILIDGRAFWGDIEPTT